jgi:hypothetical protein
VALPKPRWLVDIVTDPAVFDPTVFDPTVFRTTDEISHVSETPVDALAVPYRARLIDPPRISRRVSDPIRRTVEIQEIEFSLDNTDGSLTAGFRLLRGAAVTVSRYDETDSFLLEKFSGVVTRVRFGDLKIFCTAADVDIAALQQLIPRLKTDLGTFPNAIDFNEVIAVLFGTDTNVWLPCVNDDKLSNHYDYLLPIVAGGGAITVNAVRRDGVSEGSFATIHTSEYTVNTTAYPGYTVLRFTVRQERFGGTELHRIYADVSAPAADRNSVRACRNVLEQAWGLDQDVDTTSFDASETTVALLTLYIDGVLREQTPALEVLRGFGMVGGLTLGRSSDGLWTERVETQQVATAVEFRDGAGEGARNIVDCGTRDFRSADDGITRVVINYKLDLITGVYRAEAATRDVDEIGKDQPYDCWFIRDARTADWVADRTAARLAFIDETMSITGFQESRSLDAGDVVSVTASFRGYADAWMEIAGYSDELDRVDLDLQGGSRTKYDRIFSYQAEPLPPDGNIDFATDYSRTNPDPPSAFFVFLDGAEMADDGTVTGWADLRWTTPAVNYSKSVVHYAVVGEINVMTAPPVYGVGTFTQRIRLVSGLLYNFDVQGVNQFDLLSSGNPVIASYLAKGDTTKPDAPTAVTVREVGTKDVEIDVTAAVPPDWGITIVYRNTSNTTAGATEVARGKALRFHDKTVAYNTQYWFFAKIADNTWVKLGTAANLSDFSPTAGSTHTVTTSKLTGAGIDDDTIDTPNITPGAVASGFIESASSLVPTVGTVETVVWSGTVATNTGTVSLDATIHHKSNVVGVHAVSFRIRKDNVTGTIISKPMSPDTVDTVTIVTPLLGFDPSPAASQTYVITAQSGTDTTIIGTIGVAYRNDKKAT